MAMTLMPQWPNSRYIASAQRLERPLARGVVAVQRPDRASRSDVTLTIAPDCVPACPARVPAPCAPDPTRLFRTSLWRGRAAQTRPAHRHRFPRCSRARRSRRRPYRVLDAPAEVTSSARRAVTSRSSSTSGRRAVATTSYPRLVSSTAVALPMPVEQPVINARVTKPPSSPSGPYPPGRTTAGLDLRLRV